VAGNFCDKLSENNGNRNLAKIYSKRICPKNESWRHSLSFLHMYVCISFLHGYAYLFYICVHIFSTYVCISFLHMYAYLFYICIHFLHMYAYLFYICIHFLHMHAFSAIKAASMFLRLKFQWMPRNFF
jgi:hypothetical protein